MTWMFDQARDVACLTCAAVLAGSPVLLVTHYEDDHSWAFLDGQKVRTQNMKVVAMSSVVDKHPDLAEIANLPPGWTATRGAPGEPWETSQNM
jgi:hypothetical protein